MKILMLINWKIDYCDVAPKGKQPPDYFVRGKDYWFYRYFCKKPEVDVVDIHSFGWLEKFEKNKLRFYVLQALKVLPRLGKYDLIVSHGMQSGVVISLWRRLFRGRAKHIVFDIGSFASASETGAALRLMQFASHSIDGVIYHTSSQIDYYKKCFPWLVDRSRFVLFGTDAEYFDPGRIKSEQDGERYILCVGAAKRDWQTLVRAYRSLGTEASLRIVGHVDKTLKNDAGIEQIPVVPIETLKEQIQNAQLCVLPLESFNYSFGQMTLLQQMAMGKCVVAARVPSLVDYARDGETAVFYEPKDPGDLAEKLRWLLADAAARERIGRQAREHLIHGWNEKKMAVQIEEAFSHFCHE